MARRIARPAENVNELSRYPFADTASPDLVLPLSRLINDVRVFAFDMEPPVFISAVSVHINGFSITFRDGGTGRAVGTYRHGDGPIVRLRDLFGRPAGVIDLEDEARALQGWGVRTYAMQAEQTELACGTVIPTPSHVVTGLRTPDGSVFYGDVTLFGEQGIILRDDAGRARVDIVGDSAAELRFCVSSETTIPMTLRTINGYPGSELRDFSILNGFGEADDTALRVVPIQGGISLSIAGAPFRPADRACILEDDENADT